MSGARFSADYFDGRHSIRRPVEVQVEGDAVRIRGSETSLELTRGELSIQPRLGKMPLRIGLPGGGLLLADAQDVAAALPIPPAQGLAHRLESHLGVMLVALIGVVAAAGLGYFYGIPWAAREIAYRIPPELEARIAIEGLKGLDTYALKPTTLPAERRAELRAMFEGLAARADGAGRGARIEFRDGGWIGANAFALPGGLVVVTDQLVTVLRDDGRIAAVLAHEIGHLEFRHGSRHILQDSLAGLLSLALLGDASAVANIAVTIPTVMVHTGYSRDFEREADRYAYGLMKRTGRSPRLLGEALAALEADAESRGQECPAPSDGGKPGDAPDASDAPRKRSRSAEAGYLSTHPATEERIRAAAEAAK
jgi:Zn-dependent protease with chaperone function